MIEKFSKKCILLTGGTGCLGREILRQFQDLDVNLYSLQRSPHNFPKITEVIWSYPESLPVDKLPGKIDFIIHCAATTSSPSSDFSMNTELTRQLLELAHKKKCRKFIHISSCSAMGDIFSGERNESYNEKPDSLYGQSKLDAEKIVKKLTSEFNIDYLILRPGLLYGPYDRGGMAAIIRLISRGYFVILGSGNNKKSLTSVKNLTRVIIKSIETKCQNKTLIVVDKKALTINQIVEIVSQKLGKTPFVFKVPHWLCSAILIFTKHFYRLFPSLKNTSNRIEKMMSNNTYSIKALEESLGSIINESLETDLYREIQWLKQR